MLLIGRVNVPAPPPQRQLGAYPLSYSLPASDRVDLADSLISAAVWLNEVEIESVHSYLCPCHLTGRIWLLCSKISSGLGKSQRLL
jgi:hypothetical protein